MKGIYLCANKARHPDFNIVYQDIDPKCKCDILGDMFEVDLTPFDFIVCTPPCNWWSKTNPYYYKSFYALSTRHLLPCALIRLAALGKHFIVEGVKNIKRYTENHIFRICAEYHIKYQIVGRHIYFSNIDVDLSCPQIQDFRYGGVRVNNDGYNPGGTNVYNCIQIWLNFVVNGGEK